MNRYIYLLLFVVAVFLLTGCASELISLHGRDGDSTSADVFEDLNEIIENDTDTVSVTCGNATIEPPEACDDGEANSDETPNACRTSCVEAFCGDGVTDDGEFCDEGSLNSDSTPNACRTSCVEAFCGDGVTDDGEDCDDGPNNADMVIGACPTSCTLVVSVTCGDGTLDAGEICDNGSANSDTTPGACRTTCRPAYCGDGVTDPGERCDDGDDIDNNNCANSCVPVLEYLCRSCALDAECGRDVDRCLDIGGTLSCAIACSPTEGCPSGYTCTSRTEGYFCTPNNGACVEICNNGIDDDGDNMVDCADEECGRESYCTDFEAGLCADSIDNDADGFTDCEDSECTLDPACYDPCTVVTTPCPDVPPATCNVNNLITYQAQCSNNGGTAQCSYPVLNTVDCTASGKTCSNGACVDLCSGISCADIPAPTCLNNTTSVYYTAECVVVSGSPTCNYPQHTETCEGTRICVDGTCMYPAQIPRPTQPGDMIITEIMPKPTGAQSLKEWFELYNTTSGTFNLQECYVVRSGASFKISVPTNTLIAPPLTHITFAPTPTESTIGFVANFVYSSSSFLFSDTADTLTLRCNGTSSTTGTVIDAASYSSTTTGRAWSLSRNRYTHTENDSASNWCLASYVFFSDGNMGTPATENPLCP